MADLAFGVDTHAFPLIRQLHSYIRSARLIRQEAYKHHRATNDLFVTHSRREIDAYSDHLQSTLKGSRLSR